MNQPAENSPAPCTEPLPPHPFRTPAWLDPRIEHLPCQCPKCRPRPRIKGAPSVVPRIIVVVAGGVLLPIVSLILNEQFKVVNLQAAGTAGLIFTVLSSLAHLILSPMRRTPGAKTLSHHPPRSALLRVALLCSALLSALYWGYLALLFIPLLPLSVIGIAFMGIGLCGLCPYGAFAIALRQALRGARSVQRPWGRISLAACVFLPVVVMVGMGVTSSLQHHQLMEQIQRISLCEPYSAERMAEINELSGQEHLLVESYLRDTDHDRRLVIAEAYLRLMDSTLNKRVGWRARERNQRMINPWWFMQGAKPFNNHNQLWSL